MKKNKDKILIFFQSAIELVDILELIKKYPYGSCTLILVAQKEFLHTLEKLKIQKKFGVKIYKFSALSLKNPINLLKMFFRYRLSKDSKLVLKETYKKAFFFNLYEDFVAPIFLEQCKIKEIYYIVVYQGNQYKKIIKKYPLKNQSKINLYYKLKIFLLNLLFFNLNIDIFLQKNKFYEHIYFHLKNKKIRIKLPTNKKISKFPLLSSKNKIKQKILLYIDSNEKNLFGDNFECILNKTIKTFEINRYKVIIKKHPKEKLSSILTDNKNYIYINDPIPIELYDLKDVNLIAGFGSMALARAAEKYPNKKSLSLIKLLPSKKLTEKIILEFDSICKKNKLFYPVSFEELKYIIKKD